VEPAVVHLVPRGARGGLARHVAWLAAATAGDWPSAVVAWPGPLPAGPRPVLVHAHGYRAALWARAGRLRGLPLVVTAHGLPPAPAVVRAVGGAALWLAVSHAVAVRLRAAGVAEGRLRVLPPALLATVAPAPARPGGPPRVAALGRLAPEKGFDVLIRALGLLRGDVELLLGGDGPERRRLARLAHRLGLGRRVAFRGWVADPTPLWAAADVVAVPSRREGLGLVALEALAAGRPVVASACGGLPEIVRHGVWGDLVPPGDPRALAAALGALLADGGRRQRYAAAGRRFATARRGQTLAAAVAAAYREALAATAGWSPRA
jgi:glycosyltransferase involved in cell wall biosynthesis